MSDTLERFEIETLVIGAGVVGLAIAQELAQSGQEVLLVEAASAFGTETSARNSEVIHAGLHYAKNSLKAKFCVEGRRSLYDYLDKHAITYKRCGKILAAIGEEELPKLDLLERQAEQNDVEGITRLTTQEALALEPALSPEMSGAILSDTSGIFDSHGYMLSLLGKLEDAGGQLVLNAPVLEGRPVADGLEMLIGGDMPSIVTAKRVINSAGHGAIPLARKIEGPHQSDIPTNRFVKGSYFTVTGKTPFTRLIYPMHNAASLGLHLTVDLSGRGKLGPDAEWLPEGAEPPFNYQVDPARADVFYRTVRRYWPGLPDGALAPDYSGVRPKIVGPGEPSGDFRIEGPERHRTPGLVNLFGIESPGLTSSLAIAAHVADIVSKET
ncbi:NAD(P)/FAD-dependent oxidoreductase [Ponticaulis profundi]|uniref:NAD(P)/FAD-dependent oxidoreductase n=1 Tax=Ponticaulis profundi TaxID=2665222 RepID=A0ABW1S6V4_9PROT